LDALNNFCHWGRWLSLLYISILVLAIAVKGDAKPDQVFTESTASSKSSFSALGLMLTALVFAVLPVAVVPGTNLGLIQTITNFLAAVGL
jgi:hypothetical protein